MWACPLSNSVLPWRWDMGEAEPGAGVAPLSCKGLVRKSRLGMGEGLCFLGAISRKWPLPAIEAGKAVRRGSKSMMPDDLRNLYGLVRGQNFVSLNPRLFRPNKILRYH